MKTLIFLTLVTCWFPDQQAPDLLDPHLLTNSYRCGNYLAHIMVHEWGLSFSPTLAYPQLAPSVYQQSWFQHYDEYYKE